MSSWKLKAQKMRVPAGTVLGVIFLLFMHPSIRSLWLGGLISLVGALLRLWAAGHIIKGRVLTRSGPYAYSRNPLYLGSFFMALGIIIGGQGYWLLPVFALFFITFYFPVMKAEEQELLRSYGAEFIEYSEKVSLFIPRSRSAGYPFSGFFWSRVIRNREHRTVTGLLIAEAVLILEYFFR